MEKTRQIKIRVGTVLTDSVDKTRTVVVDRMVLHPVFKKYFRRTTKFHVHDEKNLCHAGDQVEIVECRPVSKTKRWRLMGIVKKAAV